jgi:CubicO group peptidase (beta-lactamase class C family)
MVRSCARLRHFLTVCPIIASLSVGFTSMAQERLSESANARSPAFDVPADLRAVLKEEYPSLRALMLLRGDCIAWEYLGTSTDGETLLPTNSITKSVLSILVGIAIDREYLRLDEKLSELLPETLDANAHPLARDITIRQLLTMTSGFDPASMGGVGISVSKMWTWMIERRMSNHPGIQFNYDDRSVNLLSVVLTKVLPETPLQFAQDNLFEPLNISNYRWGTDSEGNLIGSTSLNLSVTDMAKIGLLYLRKGRWGDRRIVSEKFVADSTISHSTGGPPLRTAYGYLWWVKSDRQGPDAFFAAGSGSKTIYVVPEFDLVVAMATASSVKGGSTTFVNEVVLPAARGLPVPPCIPLQKS